MAETEGLTQLLIDFMDVVQKKANGLPPVRQYRESIAAPRTSPTEEVCEKCVGRLAPEDRANLHRILEEMLRACH